MRFFNLLTVRSSSETSPKPGRLRGLKPSFESLERLVLLSGYTVTNTNGTGPGSFAQALANANTNGGTITFDITSPPNLSINGQSWHAISASPSPYVIQSSGIIIDGSSQPDYTSEYPSILLPSIYESQTANDFKLKGVTIGGILQLTSQNNVVQSNVIDSIVLQSSSGNLIGGPSPGQGNTITGNSGATGAYINLQSSSNNIIQGNQLPPQTRNNSQNINNCISLSNSSNNNIIGGTNTGERNIISGSFGLSLYITGSSGNIVQGNYIGTDSTGRKALTNGGGVQISGGASGNTIGGTQSGAGNLISGNAGIGISISGSGTTNNNVQGNLIGTDSTGENALPNGNGILLAGGASGNTIGGTQSGAGNLISGNAGIGISISGSGTTNNNVQGNLIGTDSTGENALPNGNGILLAGGASGNTIGGTQSGAGNTISGNASDGILITDSGTNGNTVQGDIIGMDGGQNVAPPAADIRRAVVANVAPAPPVVPPINAGGQKKIPNQANGVAIANGAANNPIKGNLISGNANDGVLISGAATSNNTLLGNTVGLNAAGNAEPNGNNGVEISAGATNNTIGGLAAGNGNAISGNAKDGVLITGSNTTGNALLGNYIGTDLNGKLPRPNSSNGVEITAGAASNTIGGGAGTAGNLISGNSEDGVSISGAGTSSNKVQGNWIGITIDGNSALSNHINGVDIYDDASNNTIGGATPDLGNVISGNTDDGVLIWDTGTSNNAVLSNIIGTNIFGDKALPNTANGVVIANGATQNIIGLSSAGNLISGNSADGIWILGLGTTGNVASGNTIGLQNDGKTIMANGSNGVEISDGGTANVIGGIGNGSGNTISGNVADGILVTGSTTKSNTIYGNSIGTDSNGDQSSPNGANGIELAGGTQSNAIGASIANAGNVISGNAADGVLVTGSETATNALLGNLIGVSANDVFAIANQRNGVEIADGADSNDIGLVGGTGNTISGNAGDGILIRDEGTNANVIVENQIGTNTPGNRGLPNQGNGVEIDNKAAGNTVGGTATVTGNLISGNILDGVVIHDTETDTNVVASNRIGTDLSGSVPIANGRNGVEIWGGASENVVGAGEESGAGNLISGNAADGVSIHDLGTAENHVTGNDIGTTVNGNASLGNGLNGVEVYAGASSNEIGGAGTGENNVISGNTLNGVFIHDTATMENKVEDNRIGTDSTGSLAVPNTVGVTITGGASGNTVGGSEPGAGDLISGNSGTGVYIAGTGTTGNNTEGSFIGTNADGSAALPNGGNGVWIASGASNNTVGGSESGAGDLISGNGLAGVLLSDPGTITDNIEGNRIGTDASGTAALGNRGNGVLIQNYAAGNTVGGTEAGAGNLISANALNGVVLTDAGSITNKIEGNYIGTTTSGTLALGNGLNGVLVQNGSSYNTIGGTEAGAGNVISGNIAGLAGVVLTGVSTSENKIEGNIIGADATGSNPLPQLIGVLVNLGASSNTIGGTESGAGNVISFNGSGVVISNTPTVGDNVEGNLISSNSTYGVKISAASSGDTIGGTETGARNLISANGIAGILVSDVGTMGIHIEGNTIQSNKGDGVQIVRGASTNTVGGSETGAGNVISGNTGSGVVISGPTVSGVGTTANKVEGNLIGTTILGNAASANGGDGVLIENQAFNNDIGGTEQGAGNIISGNTSNGIAITGSGTTGNTVEANYIGTDYTGSVALGNQGYGISLTYGAANNTIGGTDSAARNIISANTSGGVLLSNGGTSTNVVEGDFIGTDVTGELALGNSYCGVYVSWGASGNTIGGTASGTGNVISANSLDGIDLINSGTSGNVVQGNLIGTDKAGIKAIGNKNAGIGVINGASGNTIGGTATGAGNTLSGNVNDGINIYGPGASGNLVQGNLIGTDPTGTIALGNGVHGVLIYAGAANNTVGGTSASARNVISANGSIAVSIHDAGTSGNTIEGNDIGTDITGANALGNKNDGVLIAAATNNVIGGTVAGAGNVISANTADGVHINGIGTSGNLVEGNFIGTDATGTKALGNQSHGIAILASATNNTIGGTVAGAANVISANTGNGVFISDSGTSANLVQGNDIGTDITGTHALGNQGDGVLITSSATNNTIGGTSSQALNVISGNAVNGVLISGSGTSTNLIEGNVIGTDVTGTKALANQGNGVSITSTATNNTIGGSTSATRNIISGNMANGVLITGTGTNSNTVEGNFIGTDVTGTLALGNQSTGITITSAAKNNLIGGTASGTANVISANVANGILISASGTSTNVVEGNFIGTDATGEQALGNGYCGVYVSSGATANTIGGTASGTGNVISANSLDGIDLINSGTSGNVVQGNLIGTDKAGIKAIGNKNAGIGVINGASGNTIGGTATGAGNTLSGNVNDGINIYGPGASGNLVQGNLIGTDPTGTIALGNGVHGVLIYAGAANNTVGGTSASARNVISANGSIAVSIHDAGTSGNTIEGNDIGTDITGANALGNKNDGVLIAAATNNVIGGTAAGAGNVIAYNQGIGVLVGSSLTDPSTGNSILGNSIYGNTGLGISLGNAGVTVNSPGSPHTGPNDLLNLPVITSATRNSGSTTIQGTLNSTPNMAFRIELFSNPAADPSGYGQGQAFLGFINVTTDASGNATFSVTFSTSLASGQIITATATDANGNTSEFSQDYTLA